MSDTVTRPPGVELTHEDTPQQARALRSNRTARIVRTRFTPGTRVRSSAAPDGGAPVGVVQYTVPGRNAQGGTIVVLWPSGQVGRHSAIALSVVS